MGAVVPQMTGMVKLAVLAALVGIASAAPRIINDQTFVDAINAVPGITWQAGASERFNGMTMSEFRSMNGVKPGSWKEALKALPTETNDQITSVPDSFDSAANWPQCAKVINDVRDQSMCGCCWAFAGASAASDRMCISTNASIVVPLSAEDICFCSSDDGCQGGQIDTPWEYISQSGAVSGAQQKNTAKVADPDPFATGGFCSAFSLPHCHHHGPQGSDPYPAEGATGCPQQTSPQCPSKCDAGSNLTFTDDKYSYQGGASSANGEEGIQKAIMAGGPVETAFTVYTDFANYVSGIYSHVSGGMEGGHAVRIVGWGAEKGTKYWKVANSWNPYWGEKGYFRIKRGGNECGIEDGVTFSPATAKWAKKAPGPAPGPSPTPTPTPTPTPATGCDAQKDEADCEKAGCEWLAGIKVCIDKASTSPFFNAQSALAYTRAKQTNATSGYYSFTFTGDGCGGQCPTSGCYQEDLDCSYCLQAWRSSPPDASYKYNAIENHGCTGKKVECPECQGMMGLSRYDK